MVLVPDIGASMKEDHQPAVTGPLQERIMMALRVKPQCGKDLMKELRINSPGTIYPVLEELRGKGLIEFTLETDRAIRRKNYRLTEKGKRYVRESLTSSAHMFCCDMSLYLDTILRDLRGIIDVQRRQRVLCTLEYEEVRRYLGGSNVTLSSDLDGVTGDFDVIISFRGVGCLLGQSKAELPEFLRALDRRLGPNGMLLVVEIEKTDNLFARIFFEEIRRMPALPGMSAEELRDDLRRTGFGLVDIKARSGLLYAIARRD